MRVELGVPDYCWPFPTGGTLERSGGRMQRGSCSPQAIPREPFSFGRVRPPKVGTALAGPGQTSHKGGARSGGAWVRAKTGTG